MGTIKDTHKELVTIGQSIALLSHDIKNILEGLQGGGYVVEEGIKDKDIHLFHAKVGRLLKKILLR